MLYDSIIVLAIILGIGVILYVRKKVKFNHERLVPFREPLVPKGFWKLCSPAPTTVIVWIIRHYMPDRRGVHELMAHELNKYFVDALGWKVVIITPQSTVKNYNGVPVLQFYQKTEIEIAVSKAHSIISQGDVIETAAITAQRSKIPLVVFGDGSRAMKLCKCVNVVKEEQLPTYIDWRRYVTHTDRRYITLVNMSEANGSKQFFEIAAALPEYEFLAVADFYENPFASPKSSNVTLWNYQSDMRVVYNVTGILCLFSKEQGRFGLEAEASGIPVISEKHLETIRKLKGDSLFYKKASEEAAKKAKGLEPKYEEFKVWIEGLKW
jgi:glycosyltransferase involved in cell wall biosynthesis